MPEAEITRKQIIVVDEVGTNSYGDLTWTDKDGKPYKVKSTRKQYFEAIVPGQAVEISFSKYRGTEYPYSAAAVKDKVEVVESTHLKPDGSLGVKRDTDETKLRSMAVSYAKDLAVAKVIELKEIRAHADKFLAYILDEENILVKEAKRLIKKGE